MLFSLSMVLLFDVDFILMFELDEDVIIYRDNGDAGGDAGLCSTGC